jgi:hypothetical protein
LALAGAQAASRGSARKSGGTDAGATGTGRSDESGSGSRGSASGFSGTGSSGIGSFRSRSSADAGLPEDDTDAGFGDEGIEEGWEERSGVQIYTVHAEARTMDGTIFVREATVDFAGSEDAPYVFHAWRQGDRTLFPVGADGTPIGG